VQKVPYPAPLPRYQVPRTVVSVGTSPDGPWTPIKPGYWTYTKNTNGSADTFEVKAPFFYGASGEGALSNAYGAPSPLVEAPKVYVAIWSGFPPNPRRFSISDLTLEFLGLADDIQWMGDEQGNRVDITGRNLAGLMADEEMTAVSLLNRTASWVASWVASLFGLQAAVVTTTTPIGTYFGDQNKSYLSNTTYLDLLTWLASYENFVWRVEGSTLYFGPYGSIAAALGATNLMYEWGSGGNIQDHSIGRSPTGAKDITVTVKSYDALYKTSVSEVASSKAPRAGNYVPGTYTETLVIPGLTRDQAAKRAQAVLAELTRAQVQGYIDVVGDPRQTVDGRVQVYGLGPGLDLDYYVQQLTKTFQTPQLQMGSMGGAMNSDGYSAKIYLTSQLLINQTQVSAPLGTPFPSTTSGSPTATGNAMSTYPIQPVQSPLANVQAPAYPPWLDSGVANTVSNWLLQACALAGVTPNEWVPGMLWLIWHENPTGSPTAEDATPILVGTAGYEHAEGLFQMVPSTFTAYALPGHTNIYNPVDNAAASIRNIQKDYGNVNNIPNVFTGTQAAPNTDYKGYL